MALSLSVVLFMIQMGTWLTTRRASLLEFPQNKDQHLVSTKGACIIIINTNNFSRRHSPVVYFTIVIISVVDDFLPSVPSLEFLKGHSTACARINIQDDRVFENEETFYFRLSEDVPEERISIDTETRGTVTIEDNDGRLIQSCTHTLHFLFDYCRTVRPPVI